MSWILQNHMLDTKLLRKRFIFLRERQLYWFFSENHFIPDTQEISGTKVETKQGVSQIGAHTLCSERK